MGALPAPTYDGRPDTALRSVLLEIAVLGPLEVTRDGERVQVPAGRSSELVVRLAIEAGALVTAERLVEDLWARTAAEARRNTLQSKIAMLRRALGPTAIVSRDGGYALVVDASQVDALVVLRQATAAARLRDEGEAQGAANLCASTLALYRGPGLEAAGDAEWADVLRTRIDEARSALLEIQFWARGGRRRVDRSAPVRRRAARRAPR